MKPVLSVGALACLASWASHASAFAGPHVRSCQGVACRPLTTTSMGMAENAAVAGNEVTEALEEDAAVEWKDEIDGGDDKEAIRASDSSEERTGDIPWMELIEAAADLAGALGGAAAKAASAALDDMAPGDEGWELVEGDESVELVDVSVPYDAASSWAYAEWLAKYEREDPDLERFENFRENYRTVTIANVVTKGKIRDGVGEGEEEPELLKLNKYADLSAEEYEEVLKSLEPKSLAGLLGELAFLAGKAAVDAAKGVAARKADDAGDGSAAVPMKKNIGRKKVPAAKETPAAAEKKQKQAPRRVLQKAVPAKKKPLANEKAPSAKVAVAKKKPLAKKKAPPPKVAVAKKKPLAKKKALPAKVAAKKTAADAKKKAPPAKVTAAKKTPAGAKKEQRPAAKGAFSFFKVKTQRVEKPSKEKPKQTPRRAVQKASPAKKKPISKKKAPPAKVVGVVPTLSSGIPTLSKWRQSRDGSLTGVVGNSSNFRTGATITTSPVPKGAKAGTVVRTGTGSRYRLK